MASKKENSESAGEAKETKGEREEISNPVRVGHYDAEGYYSSDGHLREYDQSPVTEPTEYYNEEEAAQLTRDGYRYDHMNDALELPDGAPVNANGEIQLMRNDGPTRGTTVCAQQGGKRRKKKSRRKKKGGLGATGAISASLKKNKKSKKNISKQNQMRLKQLPIYKPSFNSEEIKMAPTNPLFLKKKKDAALKREKKAMLKSKKSRNLLAGGRKKRKSRKKKKSRRRRTRRRRRR